MNKNEQKWTGEEGKVSTDIYRGTVQEIRQHKKLKGWKRDGRMYVYSSIDLERDEDKIRLDQGRVRK